MPETAKIIEVADELVTALNSYVFSPPFTAARLYQPMFDIEELSGLHVSVVPRSVSMVDGTRGDDTYEIQIDVGVQMKVTPSLLESLTTQVDALMLLVERVIDYLNNRHFAAVEAKFIRIMNDPVFIPDLLLSQRVFLSVISVTYRVDR